MKTVEDKLAAIGLGREERRRKYERQHRLMKVLIFFMVIAYPLGYGLGLLILRLFFWRG